MVRIAIDAFCVHEGQIDCNYTYELRVALLPLRLNIDQEAISFLQCCASSLPNASQNEPSARSSTTLFRSVDVRSLKLKLDYWPSKVDYSGLRAGQLFEIVNLFAYEGLEVAVRRVRSTNLRGLEELAEA